MATKTSVMRSTQCTSSATVKEMSDFQIGDFPSKIIFLHKRLWHCNT